MLKPTPKLPFSVLTAALTLAMIVMGVFVVLAIGEFNSPIASAETMAPLPNTSTLAAIPQGAAETLPRTITVVGEGKVSVQPDVALANVGVDVVGDSVSEASAEAASIMEAVLEALKAQGIAEKDIQTSGYNIWIERPYSGPEPLSAGGPGEAIYHVNNMVNVVIHDLDGVGEALNVAIEAGANNIYGVTFNVDEPGESMSEARALAVEDAAAKAQELAALNQVTLGDVITISEVVGNAGGFFAGPEYAVAASVGGGPISPGELALTARLQITYAIE
jgi:uncharacterized protein YggE